MHPPPLGSVLLLQGPPCEFWRYLAEGLEAANRRVIHVGFHLGDVLWWRRRGQRLYRGRFEAWEDWLGRLISAEGVRDVLYYADRLPYHAAAVAVCHRLGVRCWAIENGYLRPDWLTMEPEGMGACSRFPRDPAVIRSLAEGVGSPDLIPRYRHGFTREAVSEVLYHLTMTVGWPLFPRYRSDKYYPPILDYLSWLRRWGFGRPERHAAKAVSAAVSVEAWPFYLVALQLQSDYQIRASSPYKCLSEMLDETIGSFAVHADSASHLVVKLHPMDNGWEGWPKRVREIAHRYRVSERVITIDGGALDQLLDRARGLITVNSTVGMHALLAGCPVVALGEAIYDLPGLTHHAGLDRFWTNPEASDPELVQCFVAALADRIQIRGSFYDREGQRVAIAEIIRRLSVPERYWLSQSTEEPAVPAPPIAAE